MRPHAPLLMLLALTASTASAGVPDLPFSFESDSEEYLIRFTDQDSHAFPLSQAIQAGDALDRDGLGPPGNPKGYDHGYELLGFLEPFFVGDRLVDFWDCQDDADTDCDNGQATTGRIRMPTTNYSVLQNPGATMSTEACIRMVLGHELFHHVEFAYVDEAGGSGCGPWPAAACEGQARMMQDQIYSDIDTAASSCISAQGSFDLYLSDTNESVWDKSYEASLFWKYLAEQHGDITQEPNVGSDFIVQWWENAVDDFETPDIVQLTRETIQDFGGAGVDTSFHDFVMANVLKDFDLSNLSASQQARWSYLDSGQGFSQADYDAVDIFGNQLVSPGQPTGFSGFVSDYGVLYHGADISGCPNLSQLRVTLDLTGSVQPTAAFGVIILRGDEVIDVDKKTGTGWNYSRWIPVQPYTQVVTVMAGLGGALSTDLDVRCITSSGGVDFPLMMNPDPTHGGPPTSFAAFDIDVDVFDERGIVRGLPTTAFEVSVGPIGGALPAPVLAVLDTSLGQRLTIGLPPELGAGAHRVAIRAAGQEIAADAVVLRGPRRPDQMLLIDRSQSMADLVGAETMLAVTQRAAALFVDTAPDVSRLGIVSFAGDGVEPNLDAVVELGLGALDGLHREAAHAALAGLVAPGGPPAIGDGLAEAVRILGSDGDPQQEGQIALLSAAAESEAASWETLRAAVLASRARVHTVALGDGADQGLLAEIAAETGGSFQFVALAPAATLPGRLADVFARLSDRANGRQRFFELEQSMSGNQSVEIAIPNQESGLRDVAVEVHWDDPTQSIGVSLQRLDGSVVQDGVAGARVFTGPGRVVAILPEPPPLDVRLLLGSFAGTARIQISGAGLIGDGAHLATGVAHAVEAPPVGRTGGFAAELPVGVEASLVDVGGALGGAAVEVSISHPDGASETLPLLDDGHGTDAAAGDGVYGGSYRRTTLSSTTGLPATLPGARGSYDLHFSLSGVDSAGHAFRRFDRHSIWVGAGPRGDSDGDGLLDRYEALHACLAESTPGEDFDGDRTSSEAEREAGTDPCHSDGDGGGEHDGSELARGANPIDPRDDALPAPGHFSVVTRVAEHIPDDPRFVPQPLAVLLRVPSARAYESLLVERRSAPSSANTPWLERARLDPRAQGGAFLDTGLPEDASFEYRMRGIDADGNESAVSPVQSATAKRDPVAPIGAVRLLGGPRTDDASVPLIVNLYRDDPGAVEMQVGSPALRSETWVPYDRQPVLPLVRVAEPTPQLLTARLRDAAGNESLRYGEQILVYPPGSLGAIRGSVEDPGDGDRAGVLVSLAGMPFEPVALSGADGSFLLEDLLPGTYEVELRDADLGGRVADVLVTPGTSTDLGIVPIPEPAPVAAAVAALGALLARLRRRSFGS